MFYMRLAQLVLLKDLKGGQSTGKKLKGKPIDLIIIIIVLLSLDVSLLHVVCKLQYSDEKHSYILYL